MQWVIFSPKAIQCLGSHIFRQCDLDAPPVEKWGLVPPLEPGGTQHGSNSHVKAEVKDYSLQSSLLCAGFPQAQSAGCSRAAVRGPLSTAGSGSVVVVPGRS